jgi:hypothetical protein
MTREKIIVALPGERRQAAPVVADQMTGKHRVRSLSPGRKFNNPKELRPRIHPKFVMQ